MVFPFQPAGARYVRRTLYLRRRLAYQFRSLAVSESWELADLARVMILVGLTVRELHEAEEDMRSDHELLIGLEGLTRLTQGRLRRPYKRGFNRRGEWITIHMPAGLLSHIATYAKMDGRSQNDALTMFLRVGILCYLTAYNRFRKSLSRMGS